MLENKKPINDNPSSPNYDQWDYLFYALGLGWFWWAINPGKELAERKG